MNDLIKIYVYYFLICLILSMLLVGVSKNNKTPVQRTHAVRVWVVPLRELLFLTPVSFVLWNYVGRFIEREDVNIGRVFIESFIAMFLTGFVVHVMFGVKSKLGAKIGITEEPDGTGFVPYPNY